MLRSLDLVAECDYRVLPLVDLLGDRLLLMGEAHLKTELLKIVVLEGGELGAERLRQAGLLLYRVVVEGDFGELGHVGETLDAHDLVVGEIEALKGRQEFYLLDFSDEISTQI